jgi:hypothetical protein
LDKNTRPVFEEILADPNILDTLSKKVRKQIAADLMFVYRRCELSLIEDDVPELAAAEAVLVALMTLEQVAARFNVKPETFGRWSKRLPFSRAVVVRKPNFLRFDARVIEELATSGGSPRRQRESTAVSLTSRTRR